MWVTAVCDKGTADNNTLTGLWNYLNIVTLAKTVELNYKIFFIIVTLFCAF